MNEPNPTLVETAACAAIGAVGAAVENQTQAVSALCVAFVMTGRECGVSLDGMLEAVREMSRRYDEDPGEEEPGTFHCPGCDQDVSVEEGAFDEHPDLCDTCSNDATTMGLTQAAYVERRNAKRVAVKEANRG